ncbi:hypothetical protein V7112_08645 [Bacillus sp. JJ1566]|uniref:hypothetical protein n=1 Tax=Bacillus sp. JJ1566 TaxID=3122961 RepID=UPI0030006965
MKVEVSKEQFLQVRQSEKVAGKSINQLQMFVPDCVGGVWGAYQVIRCYKSISKYYAEMKLIEKADSKMDAHLKVRKIAESFKAKKVNFMFDI